MNAFSFLDKHGTSLLMLVLGLVLYFKIKKAQPKPDEVALAQITAKLQRPAPLPDGSTSAQQNEYAARIEIYNAALAADTLYKALNPWEWMWITTRQERIKKTLEACASTKTSFRQVIADYKLLKPGGDLLSDLRSQLGNDYTQAVAKLNMK